ncbi:2Fe-2S iron-sulfur cluster-binding protein [Streptomyces sp. NPDC005969]|uniref:(2Fe-2S)-binding protein n=1 Tax=Streptomyces sp. NPDC005969 TaxID=3156722 RepID=UPI0033FC976A
MSNSNADNRNNEGTADEHGGWQPTAQGGEYDADATAFVQLPPEDLANIPLAAPGQGYVPPMIVPLTPATGLDPAATGSWVVQTRSTQGQETEHQATGAVHWPDPNEQLHEQRQQLPEYPQHEQYPQQGETPASTGEWNFAEATAAETSGHTGQWTIPVAEGDLPEESGEFAASAAASQWYADRTPPTTLPGGAPAPWATQPEAPEVFETVETAAEGTADTPALGTDLTQAPAPDATGSEPAEPPTEPVADATVTPEQDLPTDPPHDTAFDAPLDTPPDTPSEHPSASYVLHVNGADRPVTDAWIGESLLYVLRERLGLAGAKDGCSQGECGACSVQVDGRLVASCLVPAATAAGSEVRTVEGLAVDGEPSDVQRALADCGAVQCGFCIPGMAMTIHDLLEGNHAPSELETRQALCGNLCRCSGYRGVMDAVSEVIAGREASAEAAMEPGAATASADAHSTEARIPHQAAPGAGSVQPHLQDGGMA